MAVITWVSTQFEIFHNYSTDFHIFLSNAMVSDMKRYVVLPFDDLLIFKQLAIIFAKREIRILLINWL